MTVILCQAAAQAGPGAHYYVLIIFLSNNQNIFPLNLVSDSAQPSVKSSSKLTAPLISLGAGEEGEGGEEGGR